MSIDIKEICFPQDTAERKRWFSAASFSHPAKMHLSLQMYLIEHYTKKGDTILDPMTGSGTVLVGCALERNVICVELEEKFVKIQKDNWEKIKSLGPMLGYKMGEAIILQGDARSLPEVLADCAIFSPPYANRIGNEGDEKHRHFPGDDDSKYMATYPPNQNNIGNLPYGKIPVVISSPPYAEAQTGGGIAKKGYQGPKHTPTDLVGKRSYMPEQAGRSNGQIANLPYGKADVVCTSPPYERTVSGKELRQSEKLIGRKSGRHKWGNQLRLGDSQLHTYSAAGNNIGNLKSESYLEAMLLVYQNCHRVLKSEGLMILVVKNFIRDKKIVQLDLDTIKLCEQAGFVLIERLKRKLTQMSFWRRIYQQKYPDAPKISFEDVLVFKK